MRKVAVIGVGLHPYGKFPDKKPKQLAKTAIDGALASAGLEWKAIESAWVGHINLGMTAGARLLEPIGQSGLSITNVENASASGSYALRGAYFDVASGEFDVALALGVDMMPKRRTASAGPDLSAAPSSASAKAVEAAKKQADGSQQAQAKASDGKSGDAKSSEKKAGEKKPGGRPPTGPMLAFASQAREHMQAYGTTLDQLAMVSVKQHYNAARNPNAQYQEEVTVEQVHNSRMVADPLTVLHCCPFGDGGAAAIVASEDAVKRLGIKDPIWIDASVSASTLESAPALTDLTERTAKLAYERAGIGPDDLGLVELHDAATIEEILYVESLGLCPVGQGGPMVERGETALTGRIPVNASGGLLGMGHPFGPTGIGQVAEAFLQMRGEAGKRQIPTPPKTALAHMIGMGGTCIVHIFSR